MPVLDQRRNIGGQTFELHPVGLLARTRFECADSLVQDTLGVCGIHEFILDAYQRVPFDEGMTCSGGPAGCRRLGQRGEPRPAGPSVLRC